jgi:salicylate hydroxylase
LLRIDILLTRVRFPQIFEKTESKREIGAALGVPLNALRILDHLGILRENLKGVPWSGVRLK